MFYHDRCVLDVGIGPYWYYAGVWKNYSSIDTNGRGTITADVLSWTPDKLYDIVLCNGMYEYVGSRIVDATSKMVKPGGIVLYGFVGTKHHCGAEKYSGDNLFSAFAKHDIMNINDEYYYILCER
jgi:hypothetical protein